MEWLALFFSLLITLVLAMVEAFRFGSSELSKSELERRAQKGDTHAAHELKQRTLLPLYFGLQRLVTTILGIALIGTLASGYEVWLALVIGLILLLSVGVVTALGLMVGPVSSLRPKLEPNIWKVVQAGAPVFRLFAPRPSNGAAGPIVASKDELKQIIEQDGAALVGSEKARLLSALHFGNKSVADSMVNLDKIASVDESEPVGPLLLDRLHKMGHTIIVVVKKDLDHVTGLLYMSDLVPLDPEIKKVKDVLRPRVFYVPASAPLSAILEASLSTGRQMFIVADSKGKTVGLITLADALEHLLGSRLKKEVAVSNDPKKLASS